MRIDALLPVLVLAILGCDLRGGDPKPDPSPQADKPNAAVKGPASNDAQVSTGLTIVEGFAGVDPDTGSFLHIAGEVKNQTGGPVSHVKLYLDILDTDGKPIHVTGISEGVKRDRGLGADAPETIRAERIYLQPGESTPYFYIRDTAKLSGKQYGKHRLRAVARRAASVPKVTVTDFKYTDSSKDFFEGLSGSIVVESGACRSPEAVFASLLPDGRVRAVDSQTLDAFFQKVASAGTKAPFERKVLSRRGGAKLVAYATCSPED